MEDVILIKGEGARERALGELGLGQAHIWKEHWESTGEGSNAHIWTSSGIPISVWLDRIVLTSELDEMLLPRPSPDSVDLAADS